jgi:5-methylcytosine-specific restriction protein A
MPTGWIGSNRKAELPRNWPQIVARILTRDLHRCQWIRVDTDSRCLAHANQVDHIEPGGPDEDWNLQALCAYHHGKKSGREGGIASGKARAKKAAASKPLHPGLLDATPRPAPDENPPPF